MKVFLLFVLPLLCFGSLLQGAAQKNIYGVVSVRTSFSSIAKENRGAVDELFQCVTGKECVTGPESKKDTPTLLAQIAATTGLPVKEDDVLVSLHIDDAPEVEVVHKSRDGWHKGYMCCSQLTDADGKQARVAGMWPVHWFMHKKEGDVVTLPLWGGAFLAHLTVGPAPEEQSLPFCKLLAFNAGYALASEQMAADEDICRSERVIAMGRASQVRPEQFADFPADFQYAIAVQEECIKMIREDMCKKQRSLAWQAAEKHYGISENN
jgi:hypothetical protein